MKHGRLVLFLAAHGLAALLDLHVTLILRVRGVTATTSINWALQVLGPVSFTGTRYREADFLLQLWGTHPLHELWWTVTLGVELRLRNE